MKVGWLNTKEFADLVGISRQAAHRVLQRSFEDKQRLWRDAALDVRLCHGRGGRSGVCFEVQRTSLPVSYHTKLPGRTEKGQLVVATTQPSSSLNSSATERNWWLTFLQPVFAATLNTKARGKAAHGLAGKQVFDWRGRPFVPSLRQIQRRCAAYEREQSISALSRQGRSDRGRKRVFISRAWDNAVSERFDNETRAEIADGLRQQVKGLIKGGATGKIVAVLASEYLKKVTVANGIHQDDLGELDRICKVPRALIRAEQHLKKVYRHKNDRKASDDDRPRVKRAITGMQPMDCVVMDVHHINVLLQRQNGTTGTPKLLGFMDIATRRVWCELVFIETKGGVRNVDVIEAFAAMAQHSAFGLPRTLYCDNGKEYLFADFLDDAMQLLVPNVGEPGKSRVIRALPYNASAKPIEAWFGHFEQQFLKTCPGYIGDDRMNPKRPAPGKLPTPFTGDFAAFKTVFKGLLKAYEVMPQSGALKGLSPSQSFEAHVRQGWAATVIDPDRLNTVFTKPEPRKVRQHGISVGGRRWSCDELDTWFHDTVTVHIPQYHGNNALRLTKPDGSLLGIAHPEEEFSFFDPRGAKRSAERNTRRNRALRNADRSAPDIDIGAELVKLSHSSPEVVPNVPRGTLTVTQELEHQQALRPEYGEPRSESEDERHRREIAAARDIFIRTIGRN